MEQPTNNNHLQLIVTTIQHLSLARDLETVMKIVKNTARKLTGADGATFILRDGDFCYYADEDAISPLWKGHRFPINNCISGWAMLNQTHAIIEDIYSDARIPHDAYKPTFVKSLAMVPIRTIKPIGAIGNYWANSHLPTKEEIHLLQSLADITAVTLENIQVYSELENRVKERTAELQAVNKELESFSYSVSHDLRAPLRAINGYMTILKEDYAGVLDDEAKRIIETAVSNAQNMNTLIDGLLQFSRMGKKELVKTTVAMKTIVEEICQEQKGQEKDRNIEIIIGNLPDADVDTTLIKQVWVNYISNAIKYTKHKPISKIEIGNEDDSEKTIYYIKDNGIGFDMQYGSKLFGAFQRLHSPEEFPGTGIGLAIVQRIILKHGGTAWAQSKPNEGTTFYFSLPKNATSVFSISQ